MENKIVSPGEALDILRSKGISFKDGSPPSSESLFMLWLAEQGFTPKYKRSFYKAVCTLALVQEGSEQASKISRELAQIADKLNALNDDESSSIDPVVLVLLHARGLLNQ